MTLDAALTKATRDFDALAERRMRECEEMYIAMDATSVELAAGLDRERAILTEGRRQIVDAVRVAFAIGPDAVSLRVN